MIRRLREAIASIGAFIREMRSAAPTATVEAFLLAEIRRRPISGMTTSELLEAAEASDVFVENAFTGGGVMVALARLEHRGDVRCRAEARGRRSTRRWFPCGGRRSKRRMPVPAGVPARA